MKTLKVSVAFLVFGSLATYGQSINGTANQSITAIPNASLSNPAITFSGTCGVTSPGSTALGATATYSEATALNAQTGTTYTYLGTDCGKMITRSNAGSLTDTLTNTNFSTGNSFYVENIGAGTDTLTPSSGTINANANLQLTTGQGGLFVFDGANWEAFTGKGTAIPNVMTSPVTADTCTGATSTITASAGKYHTCTLSINTTIALSGLVAGQDILFDFIQAAGAFTVTWPAAVHGGFTVGSTSTKHNVQEFYSPDGTNLYAKTSGVINQ